LRRHGLRSELFSVSTIKPLDAETILRSAGRTGHVVTVEDHSIHGGLGSAVAEMLGEVMPTPVERIGAKPPGGRGRAGAEMLGGVIPPPRRGTGVPPSGESGPPKARYARHGLDPDGI